MPSGREEGKVRRPRAADLPPVERAQAVALRYLATRPRSEQEIRRRLAREELEQEVVEGCIAWLFRLGYLDDRRFGRERAEGLLRSGKVGPRLVLERLARNGLGPAASRQALSEAMAASSDETSLAREALRRRTRGALPEDPRDRARLARWLRARGFSGTVVSRVIGVHTDVE
jgi:regulatory protein